MKLGNGSLRDVLRNGSFRNFWIAFTLSGVGDAMTKTALVWYVFETTRSAAAVGLLLLAYAGPVAVGGIVAGYLLDRFDRRLVMLADSVVRGVVVGSVPAAAALGHLTLAHVYVAAVLYGFFYMIGLAGGPTLIPSLVRDNQLTAANSLETLGFTISWVVGPALAGLLIAGIGAPYVLALDALTYFAFALVLATMRATTEPPNTEMAEKHGYRMIDAVRLLLRTPMLLSTTLMFMSFNAGVGFLEVWLPVQAADIAGDRGAQLYGILLTVLAVGETVGALAAGSISWAVPEGRLICLAQLLAGLGLALALLGDSVWSIASALFLLGAFSAPMTAWAQTLRMRVIPPALHGRSFALLRTLMQSSAPAFSAIGGVLLPVVGVAGMIGLSAGLVGVPGAIGIQVRDLTGAGMVPAPSADKAQA
jgi:MFS family permease